MRRRPARRLSATRGWRVAVVFAAAGATAVAAGAAAAPAGADQTLEATGSITYTWQGDPSLGCAAVGMCDVQGALIVDAQGNADLQRLRHQSIISLNSGSATVRVLTGSGSSASECVDTAPNEGGPSVFVRGSAGGLVGSITPALSSGRCAGPLGSDLQGVTLSARRSAGKHPSFDLRTNKTFVAGPFLGTLVSTVTLRPAPSFGSNTSSSSGSFSSGPGRARHKVFTEHVRLRYQVTGLSEPLTISFAGENDPFCTIVGSCGVTGDVALSTPGFSGTLTLQATRQVPGPRNAAQVFADLKRGRMSLFGVLSSRLDTSESFTWPDGSRCQDSAPNTAVLTVGSFPPGRAMNVGLTESSNTVDLLRTHCPGPTTSDVFGANEGIRPLAGGEVSAAELLAPRTTLTLANPGDFNGVGYAGSRSGAVGFSLTLEGMRAGTSEAIR